MSEEGGHESPPPERSTGPQMKDTPGSGHGIGDSSNKEQANKKALEVSFFEVTRLYIT